MKHDQMMAASKNQHAQDLANLVAKTTTTTTTTTITTPVSTKAAKKQPGMCSVVVWRRYIFRRFRYNM